MALGLVPEIIDPVDVIVTVGKQLGMVDAKMVEIRYIQYVVAPPTIRIDDTIRDYLTLDDRDESGPRCVGNNLGVDLPTPV